METGRVLGEFNPNILLLYKSALEYSNIYATYLLIVTKYTRITKT